MAQLGDLIVNGVSRLLSKLYVSDSVTAPSFIGKLTGNADTATKLTSSAGSATQPVYFSDGKPVATTYTLGKSVPADAKFTDTDTWRGVQNNLTSTVTDQSLSAAQGKVLKDLIDRKAPASHTHSQYYDSTISRTKGTVLAAPASANGGATFRTLTKSDVGLGSVDNTADSAKSVKAATKLQTYKQGSTTETYGDSYPLYAQWSGQDVFLKCDNYAVWADRASVSNSANAVAWGNVTGKPSTFTPSSHTHGVIKNLSVSGTTITYTKDDNTTGTITTQDTNTTYGTFKGATTSEAGSTGLVIAPVAGNANRYLRSDGTWAVPPDTNTTYGVFAKATADAAGSTGLVPAPAKGQQTYYLRGDGTWAVPANTWRGIQDNLTSSSTTDSLSANQGKVLKGLIDGKAASGHTHNYAGSSSAGGAATSANKVNNALTINLNGTSQGAWDGSSAKSISITAASVGATSVTISRW